MKQGWETKKLGEVAEYFNGLTYSPKDVSEKGTIVLRSSNIQKDELDFSDIIRVDVNIKEKLFVKNGDILMCSRNGSQRLVGKTAPILNLIEQMTFGTFMMVIRSEYSSYLLWYFKTDEFKKQISSGENTMINQVTRYMLDDIKIPLPPLPEQQRIVSLLDEAFAAIAKAQANAEQNLKNAKELFEIYLQGVFENGNWGTKTIQEISKVINGYAFASKDFKPTNSVKSIKITNVGVNEFVEEADNHLPEMFKVTLKDFQVRKGNIVIALTRTIISSGLKVAMVPASYDGALVNQRVAALVPNEKLVDQNFLYYYLTTSSVAKYVLEHVNTLMQPNLSISDLKNMPVPFPSLKEQQAIVRNLDALRAETQKLEAIYQQKLLNLEELKKSVLQKAFNGDL